MGGMQSGFRRIGVSAGRRPVRRAFGRKLLRLKTPSQLNFKDVNPDGTFTLAAPIITNLCPVAVDTGQQKRLDEAIHVWKAEVRYRITDTNVNTAGEEGHSCRVMVVRDTNSNGATITAAVVLQYGATTPIESPQLSTARTRFHILSDTTHCFNSQIALAGGAATYGAMGQVCRQFTLQLGGRRIVKKTDGDDAASYGEGELYILFLNAKAATLLVRCRVRTYYTE